MALLTYFRLLPSAPLGYRDDETQSKIDARTSSESRVPMSPSHGTPPELRLELEMRPTRSNVWHQCLSHLLHNCIIKMKCHMVQDCFKIWALKVSAGLLTYLLIIYVTTWRKIKDWKVDILSARAPMNIYRRETKVCVIIAPTNTKGSNRMHCSLMNGWTMQCNTLILLDRSFLQFRPEVWTGPWLGHRNMKPHASNSISLDPWLVLGDKSNFVEHPPPHVSFGVSPPSPVTAETNIKTMETWLRITHIWWP